MRTRGIDHLVICVDRLAAARAHLEALGFAVQADARHPFGTGNACVMFADGTYLEPLAVLSRDEVREAVVKGNDFCRRQDAFRFRQGRGGAMLAVKSANADEARQSFAAAGLDGGPILDFRRPQTLADGTERQIGVRLAFARDDRSADFTVFACEHLAADILFSEERTRHPNGATGLSRVILGETNPTDFQYLLQTGLSDRDPRASSLGLSFDLDEGPDLDILGAAGEAAFLGTAGHSERGPRLLAAVVTVPDLEAIKARAEAAGLSHAMRAGRLVVDASADFSFILAFEEAHK